MSSQLGPTGSYITFSIQYDYQYTRQAVVKSIVHGKQGTGGTTSQGSFHGFSFTLNKVTEDQRSLVNSWWQTSTNLRFIEDTTSPSSFYTVRIVNQESLFQKFRPPYFDTYFTGEVLLETI